MNEPGQVIYTHIHRIQHRIQLTCTIISGVHDRHNSMSYKVHWSCGENFHTGERCLLDGCDTLYKHPGTYVVGVYSILHGIARGYKVSVIRINVICLIWSPIVVWRWHMLPQSLVKITVSIISPGDLHMLVPLNLVVVLEAYTWGYSREVTKPNTQGVTVGQANVQWPMVNDY